MVNAVKIQILDAYTMSDIPSIMEKIDLLTTVVGWCPVKKLVLMKAARFTLEHAYFKIFGRIYRQTRCCIDN